MTEGEEITALIKSYYDQGKIPQDDPQLASKLAAISAKYAQQPTQTQQQTTTQDTGALANVGTDTQQQDTGQKVYLTSNQGNLIPGQKSSRFVYMVDQDTGQQYVYDDNEGKSGDTGFQGSAPPTGANLKITAINSKDDEDWKLTDLSDQNLTFGGVTDPETLAQYTAQANREPGYESGGGGLFYEYNGREYYTPDNTGQSIPVGSTNITRDPTQLSYIEKVADPQIGDDEGTFIKRDKDPSTYTQPVLTKTFQGYEPVTGMYSDVEGITPEQYAQLSPAEKLKLSQSDVPTASTDFKDFFDMGSGRFDLGGFFGMDIDPTTGTSGLVLSNPPSNQFNLGKFLNQTEAFGTQNFLRSQSTDVLNDIILGGNTLDALMGKNFKLPDGSLYYDKIYNVVDNSITDPTDMRRYGSTKSNADVTLTDFISGGGGAIEGFDMGQLEGFFNDLATNKNPVTGDTMYSDTAYSIDPFNISGGDDSLQYDYAYSQRPLTAQAVRAYKGGLGPYANVQYLTRYGYNPTVGDEMLRYDEASGVYFDPVTNLPINPEMLEGFALSDPETVELGGTESVYRGQMTTNPVTGEKLYYDAEGNPVTEEQYQLFTEPMETGVT
jgi:hypothetical protein